MSYRFVIPAVALGLALPQAAVAGEPSNSNKAEATHTSAETVTTASAPILAMKTGQRAAETAKAMLEDTEPTLKFSDVLAMARKAIETARSESRHEQDSAKPES